MNPHLTHVAIISDCPLLRYGVSHLIDTAPDLHRVNSVRCIGEQHYEATGADVVLLNLQGSIGKSRDLIARMHREGHAVVVLSASDTQAELVMSIEAGARGYLSQYTREVELLTAVRTVAAGRSYFSANLNAQGLPECPSGITDRERQILKLVANGATDREIAFELKISEHTVHSHLDRLRSKTGSRRRADLTRLALQRGMAGEISEEG
ncbi:response regulator transcription factor [Streptomyces sp. NPDC005526]|uniref:response regulator transcription factor n=1 Tax=Streptomyces sp. NPDC005526 TaxID=3156885 RepID=UPI0033ADAECA